MSQRVNVYIMPIVVRMNAEFRRLMYGFRSEFSFFTDYSEFSLIRHNSF